MKRLLTLATLLVAVSAHAQSVRDLTDNELLCQLHDPRCMSAQQSMQASTDAMFDHIHARTRKLEKQQQQELCEDQPYLCNRWK